MLEYLVQFRYNIQYYINDSLRISDQERRRENCTRRVCVWLPNEA